MHICFAILHFEVTHYTSDCIKSILKLDKINDCKIVVLDNGSKNKSFQELKQEFGDNALLDFVRSETNQGFSSGINLLYQYCRNKYDPDFIVMLNNDTAIEQRDFISRLIDVYHKSKAYIIGPDIYCPKKREHQSPLLDHVPDSSEVTAWIKQYESNISNIDKYFVHLRIKYIINNLIYSLPFDIKKIYYRIIGFKKIDDYKKDLQENVVLQGACFIVTKQYIKSHDKLLEPDTKFYCEEILLSLKCRTLNYKTIYTNQIQVIHYDGGSSRRNELPQKSLVLNQLNKMRDAHLIYIDCLQKNPWI